MEDTSALDPVQNDAPAPEDSEFADVEAGSVIIIQPGSRYVRLGLASDAMPHSMLHAVARKLRSPDLRHARVDPFLVKTATLDKAHQQIVDEARDQVYQVLLTSFRSDGRKRFAEKRVAELNLGAKNGEQVPVLNEDEDITAKTQWLEPKCEVIVGDEILYLHPDSGYNVQFPFHRGDINTDLASVTAIIADLETIWAYAIEHVMHIPLKELSKYRAVLIIPALYHRSLIKHYLTLLLCNLGFGHAFVLQDHVAATFGAGLGFACVVDVGDQKTSVSCVEDGISHPETRIHLNYGGADITQVFHYLLRKVNFPYSACDPVNNRFDAKLLYKLKEDNCHLDLDICGLAAKNFSVSLPGQSSYQRYTLYVSDECIMAPMALFHPELFELTSANAKQRVRYFTPNPGDPEDPHDNIYLTETSRKYTKAGDATVGEILACESDPAQNLDDDLDIVNEDGANGVVGRQVPNSNDQHQFLSLDAAIRKSIDNCPSEDVKRKMYSCILLVGGGLRFNGVRKILHQKLSLQLPATYRSDPMEIVVDAKDLSCEITSWKGAAILACLESAKELWIKPDEWRRFGQKLLREKAPFPWA